MAGSTVNILLDNTIGIQSILTPDTTPEMPTARELPQTIAREAGLETLFRSTTTTTIREKALTPSVGDGTILTPAVFSQNLHSSLEKLKRSKHPDVRSFVRAELEPLLDNEELLQAYVGLLVGG